MSGLIMSLTLTSSQRMNANRVLYMGVKTTSIWSTCLPPIPMGRSPQWHIATCLKPPPLPPLILPKLSLHLQLTEQHHSQILSNKETIQSQNHTCRTLCAFTRGSILWTGNAKTQEVRRTSTSCWWQHLHSLLSRTRP